MCTLSGGDLGSQALQCLISLAHQISTTARSSALLPPRTAEIHTRPARTPPPPSLPPSIFNTRDTSPLPQHGAHMPVILNLIKETFESGNTRSRERRFVFCLSSFLPSRAVSYFVFKNPLAQTESRRPPLSLPAFLPRSLSSEARTQSKRVPSAWRRKRNIYIYIWVCVERDKTVLVMLIHRVHPWEPSEAASHRVDGELTWGASP